MFYFFREMKRNSLTKMVVAVEIHETQEMVETVIIVETIVIIDLTGMTGVVVMIRVEITTTLSLDLGCQLLNPINS